MKTLKVERHLTKHEVESKGYTQRALSEIPELYEEMGKFLLKQHFSLDEDYMECEINTFTNYESNEKHETRTLELTLITKEEREFLKWCKNNFYQMWKEARGEWNENTSSK